MLEPNQSPTNHTLDTQIQDEQQSSNLIMNLIYYQQNERKSNQSPNQRK